MKKLFLSITLSLAFSAVLHAQNAFPLNGDVTVNTSKPSNHGGGYTAIWMPNAGAIMPENSPDYGGIMITSNVVRNSTTNIWGFANPSMAAWKLFLGSGPNADNLVVSRSAANNFVEQALFKIDKAGNVGIGTISPQNKLDVNGVIHSKSVLIDLNGWNDYVFDKDYKLLSLKEVKTYIDQNHHLPEISSEQEMIKKGLDVSEMNKLLMKKVEELTLYLIEKDKQVTELQKRVSNLELAHSN